MSAATLEQVLASLGSVYDPQVKSVQQQQGLIPQQLQADESSLQGAQKGAFDSILNGARSRGTGVAFGGIPLGEQAGYTANTFLPEMAKLRNTYATKDLSLQDALNQINERRASTGQQIYQAGVNQDFAERQFEYTKQKDAQDRADAEAARAAAARAAASGAFDPSFGGGSTDTTAAAPGPAPAAKNYIGNNDLRGHLAYLAKSGNSDAAVALKYVGNDGRYNLSPYVVSPAIIAALNRLGAVNVYKASTGKGASAPKPGTQIGGNPQIINKILGR